VLVGAAVAVLMGMDDSVSVEVGMGGCVGVLSTVGGNVSEEISAWNTGSEAEGVALLFDSSTVVEVGLPALVT